MRYIILYNRLKKAKNQDEMKGSKLFPDDDYFYSRQSLQVLYDTCSSFKHKISVYILESYIRLNTNIYQT